MKQTRTWTVFCLFIVILILFWASDLELVQNFLLSQKTCLPTVDVDNGCGVDGSAVCSESADTKKTAALDGDTVGTFENRNDEESKEDGAQTDRIVPANIRPLMLSLTQIVEVLPLMQAADADLQYAVVSGEWLGRRQKVHILLVNPAAEKAQLQTILSFDRLFGYETLSDMANRAGAFLAVNGGFGYPDGRPGGFVMQGGEAMHAADPRFPVLFLTGKSARLYPIATAIRLVSDIESAADYLNPYPFTGGVALFTPAFGSQDRLENLRTTVVVDNGIVTKTVTTKQALDVPPGGFLISAIGDSQTKQILKHFPLGASVRWFVKTLPAMPEGTSYAMSCGSFLVRDGKNVAPASDPWAGALSSPAPRTAVGMTAEGQVVFVVAEGRIPEGASGFTGEELGSMLSLMGLKEAALLDGGASSEIWMNGHVLNSLSSGKERLLPSGIVIKMRE